MVLNHIAANAKQNRLDNEALELEKLKAEKAGSFPRVYPQDLVQAGPEYPPPYKVRQVSLQKFSFHNAYMFVVGGVCGGLVLAQVSAWHFEAAEAVP